MYIVQLQYLFAHKEIIWSLGIVDVSIRSDGSWINSSQQDATNTKDTRYYRKSNCYAFNYEIFLLSYPQYFLSLQSSQRSVSFYFPYPSPECNIGVNFYILWECWRKLLTQLVLNQDYANYLQFYWIGLYLDVSFYYLDNFV